MKRTAAIVLALVLVLSLCACGAKNEAAPAENEMVSAEKLHNGDTIGEGKTTFDVSITGKDGAAITVTVHTDEETVGEALQSLGVIDGEEGDYGIYIKTVNQDTADYETDGAYWAFYVNGAYAATGADMTPIEPDTAYAFVIETMQG